MIEEIKEFLKPIGDKVSEYSGFLVKKLSELGLSTGSTTNKIIAILILLTIFYFSLKITQRVVKFLLIILSIILLSSIIFSFF